MRYTHDCDSCRTLGTWHNYDLYYCNKHGIETLIARWGDEGFMYESGLEGTTQPLLAARALAQTQGFLPRPGSLQWMKTFNPRHLS